MKGYEAGKNDYVVIDDEELKKIAPPTATTMDILQFVKSNDVDPILFESSYYVAPDEKLAKPYALFLAALTETKCDAIAKIAMHNREHRGLFGPPKVVWFCTRCFTRMSCIRRTGQRLRR